MKHHLYQIYYGGFKIILKGMFFCKDCQQIRNATDWIHNTPISHNTKKLSGNP